MTPQFYQNSPPKILTKHHSDWPVLHKCFMVSERSPLGLRGATYLAWQQPHNSGIIIG